MDAEDELLSPIDRALEAAEECHLVEEDGGRWEVLDLEMDGDRVWVTARMEEREGTFRTFDTVLTAGTALEWRFPDGERIRMETSGSRGRLRWEQPAGGSFFDDPFLAG